MSVRREVYEREMKRDLNMCLRERWIFAVSCVGDDDDSGSFCPLLGLTVGGRRDHAGKKLWTSRRHVTQLIAKAQRATATWH